MPSQGIISAEERNVSDILSNLTERLVQHAAQLPPEEREAEERLRPAVVEAVEDFSQDRIALARHLIQYRTVFKKKRQWTRVVEEIGNAIDVSSRTVFRLIEAVEHSQTDEEKGELIDVSEINGLAMTKEDRRLIRARLAIRSALEEIPAARKAQALGELISEEAFQIWGCRGPFSVEVLPKPSRFTIDGRKRLLASQLEEEEEWKTL